MTFLKLVLLLATLTLVSCASKHTFMRGTVALKLNDTTGIACLDSNETKLGDTLYLYNNDCSQNSGRDGGVRCKLVPGGEAEVTKIVNDHYSEFQTRSNISFDEGSIISSSK